MAAFSHTRAGSRANNGGLNNTFAGQQLPSGLCNFHDLRPGASVTSCGCKRFWLNVDHYTGQQTADRAWCFCGHHACFHDFSSQLRQGEPSAAPKRPSRGDNVGHGDSGLNVLPPGYAPAQRASQSSPKRLTGLGIRPDSRSQSQSINTRIWDALNGFARRQEEAGYSDVPSTAAPSVDGETNADASYAMPGQAQQYSMGPPVHIPQNTAIRPSVEELSATEVNTPSVSGTPDFRAAASSSHQTGPSPGHLPPGTFTTGPRSNLRSPAPVADRPALSTSPSTDRADTRSRHEPSLLDIQNLIKSHSQRLDLLESLSFSHVPVEELQERFEHFDGRLLDLEHWRSERDREHASSPLDVPSGSKRRRLSPADTDSFSSDISFDSNAAAHTEAVVMATLATNAITDPRIEALENRVTNLESTGPPSYALPWQVQVVLLPWGRQLHGIWFSSTESTQRSLKSSTQDEWSGAQSLPKLSFKSSEPAAWTTESIQAWANDAQEWLSPKACGPTGTVFQRLASRGLVRDVTFTASDSRHILGALRETFGGFVVRSEASSEWSTSHQALAEDFIPLRKVRKSSRLRFLAPSEMITAATWTAEFLDSSVFMKVGNGQRRLYLTTSDAYLQPSSDALTWPALRQLPIFDATAGEQAAQATGSAIEACWSYNEHLDHALSTRSSFASRTSPWNANTPNPHDDAAYNAEDASTSAEERPRHHRTVSLPTSSLGAISAREEFPKRRVASFETAGMVPIHVDDHGLEVQAKRRRISLSPEAERRGVNFTPRWSREPPSPFTSDAAMEARSQGTSSRTKRGATPFAYATPHSNTQYVGRPQYFGGDGDTEADTDLAGDLSDRGEEEWEGVDDDPATCIAAPNISELNGEDDVDEHDDFTEGHKAFGA